MIFYWGGELENKKSKTVRLYWRYLCLDYKELHYKNVFILYWGIYWGLKPEVERSFSYIRSYHFNYIYCCLNYKKQLACLVLTQTENNAKFENNDKKKEKTTKYPVIRNTEKSQLFRKKTEL